ncbi:MAG: hypothetical protein AAB383_00085 [Patescibacteria group bacterium]
MQEDDLETSSLQFLDTLHARLEAGDAFDRGIQLKKELWAELEPIRLPLEELIQELFAKNEATIDEIKSRVHTLYAELVLRRFDLKKPRKRHLLAANPIDPDGQGVWRNVGDVAEALSLTSNGVELTQEKVRTLLLLNGTFGTRDLNQADILKIELIDKNFSPEDVYRAYQKVKITGKTSDNATLAFCKKLGLFHETSREEALKTIRITKAKAWAFLDQIFKYANKELAEMDTDQPIKKLSVDHHLQPMSVFEWLEVMYDQKNGSKVRMEAQLLLKFALETFNVRSSPAYAGSTNLKEPVSASVQNSFESAKANEEVRYHRLRFNETGDIVTMEEGKFSDYARKIKLDDFDEFSKKLIFIDFDDKGCDPILTKFMTKEPDGDTKEIKDHLRCTVVAPDLTLKDLYYKDEAKKDPSRGLQYTYAVLKSMGENAGLKYRDFKTMNKKAPLKVGEFTIEENLDGPNALFRNIKLLGIVANPQDEQELGTTLEIQFNTIDLHEVINGLNSPFDRAHYEGLRWIATADNCLPRSLYEQAHECLDAKKRTINSRRDRAIEASNVYIETRESA